MCREETLDIDSIGWDDEDHITQDLEELDPHPQDHEELGVIIFLQQIERLGLNEQDLETLGLTQQDLVDMGLIQRYQQELDFNRLEREINEALNRLDLETTTASEQDDSNIHEGLRDPLEHLSMGMRRNWENYYILRRTIDFRDGSFEDDDIMSSILQRFATRLQAFQEVHQLRQRDEDDELDTERTAESENQGGDAVNSLDAPTHPMLTLACPICPIRQISSRPPLLAASVDASRTHVGEEDVIVASVD